MHAQVQPLSRSCQGAEAVDKMIAAVGVKGGSAVRLRKRLLEWKTAKKTGAGGGRGEETTSEKGGRGAHGGGAKGGRRANSKAGSTGGRSGGGGRGGESGTVDNSAVGGRNKAARGTAKK